MPCGMRQVALRIAVVVLVHAVRRHPLTQLAEVDVACMRRFVPHLVSATAGSGLQAQSAQCLFILQPAFAHPVVLPHPLLRTLLRLLVLLLSLQAFAQLLQLAVPHAHEVVQAPVVLLPGNSGRRRTCGGRLQQRRRRCRGTPRVAGHCLVLFAAQLLTLLRSAALVHHLLLVVEVALESQVALLHTLTLLLLFALTLTLPHLTLPLPLPRSIRSGGGWRRFSGPPVLRAGHGGGGGGGGRGVDGCCRRCGRPLLLRLRYGNLHDKGGGGGRERLVHRVRVVVDNGAADLLDSHAGLEPCAVRGGAVHYLDDVLASEADADGALGALRDGERLQRPAGVCVAPRLAQRVPLVPLNLAPPLVVLRAAGMRREHAAEGALYLARGAVHTLGRHARHGAPARRRPAGEAAAADRVLARVERHAVRQRREADGTLVAGGHRGWRGRHGRRCIRTCARLSPRDAACVGHLRCHPVSDKSMKYRYCSFY
eukprot:Rhum_TRINITY_DN8946_c0_g1::Rhum_TRINITY_DN8946_c0_g1_i1::g.30778::m.30778